MLKMRGSTKTVAPCRFSLAHSINGLIRAYTAHREVGATNQTQNRENCKRKHSAEMHSKSAKENRI